jgi:bacillithiol system protein YtxJ
MGLLKKLFSKQEDVYSNFNWLPLIEMNQLDEIVKSSSKKTVAIFKHSTRCGVSRGVVKQFEKQFEIENINFYFLDLLNFRDISNTIATKFNVMHQSPQLIVLKNKKVVANASHHSILDVDLIKFI